MGKKQVDRYRKDKGPLRKEKRAFCESYKLTLGCADCGYAQWPESLEFDHLPGYEKCFEIGKGIGYMGVSWERLILELEKCDVVCSNCHRHRSVVRLREKFSGS